MEVEVLAAAVPAIPGEEISNANETSTADINVVLVDGVARATCSASVVGTSCSRRSAGIERDHRGTSGDHVETT